MYQFNKIYRESLNDAFGAFGEEEASKEGNKLKLFDKTIINGYLTLFYKGKNSTSMDMEQIYIGVSRGSLFDNELVNVHFKKFFQEYSKVNKQFGTEAEKKKLFLNDKSPPGAYDKGFDVFWEYFGDQYLLIRQNLWERLLQQSIAKELLNKYSTPPSSSFSLQINNNLLRNSIGPGLITFCQDEDYRLANSAVNNWYNRVVIATPYFISPDFETGLVVVYTMAVGGFTVIQDPTDKLNNEALFSKLYDYFNRERTPVILPFIRYHDTNKINQFNQVTLEYGYV